MSFWELHSQERKVAADLRTRPPYPVTGGTEAPGKDLECNKGSALWLPPGRASGLPGQASSFISTEKAPFWGLTDALRTAGVPP